MCISIAAWFLSSHFYGLCFTLSPVMSKTKLILLIQRYILFNVNQNVLQKSGWWGSMADWCIKCIDTLPRPGWVNTFSSEYVSKMHPKEKPVHIMTGFTSMTNGNMFNFQFFCYVLDETLQKAFDKKSICIKTTVIVGRGFPMHQWMHVCLSYHLILVLIVSC